MGHVETRWASFISAVDAMIPGQTQAVGHIEHLRDDERVPAQPMAASVLGHPNAYDFVMAAFAIAVIALFAIGLASRLYLTPRAEGKRRQDFSATRVGWA
jgi:hypothetical protein